MHGCAILIELDSTRSPALGLGFSVGRIAQIARSRWCQMFLWRRPKSRAPRTLFRSIDCSVFQIRDALLVSSLFLFAHMLDSRAHTVQCWAVAQLDDCLSVLSGIFLVLTENSGGLLPGARRNLGVSLSFCFCWLRSCNSNHRKLPFQLSLYMDNELN